MRKTGFLTPDLRNRFLFQVPENRELPGRRQPLRPGARRSGLEAVGSRIVHSTVQGLLVEARRRLAAAPFAPPAREAGLLLAHALGVSEAQVLARHDEDVPAAAADRFLALLERRLAGEPFAYLTGEREFYGRGFRVDRRVLIPRPETEHLVEAALALPLPPGPRILDLGTGSGCLAVTLAAELPAATVVATDLSLAALAVARANAAATAWRRGSASPAPTSTRRCACAISISS